MSPFLLTRTLPENATEAALRADVLRGLTHTPKTLPPKWFYDARGSALVILGIMAATALGTAAVAPFIEQGLAPLALASFALEAAAVLCLLALPTLQDA